MLKEEVTLCYEIFGFHRMWITRVLLTHRENSFCETEEVAEIINACWYLI